MRYLNANVCGQSHLPTELDKMPISEKENLQNEIKKLSENEDTAATDPLEKKEVVLPQEFKVKYLGHRDATGLWGIKHTRTPVDEMVGEAKQTSKCKILPLLSLHISEKGVKVTDTLKLANTDYNTYYPLEAISYGVQDLMFTRVFAMIIVREEAKTNLSIHPFQCHAFVCDSKSNARKLTFALAEAFQIFSKKMKSKSIAPRKFAIDLRVAEEMESDLRLEDSEA